MVCLRNICLNTLHKGDNDDDDNDNNNNNKFLTVNPRSKSMIINKEQAC
jgi:hypothetical protein